MKEKQYSKIIAALKQTAEENAGKSKSAQEEEDPKTNIANPSNKEWKDTLDELNQKKEAVNNLETTVLEMEL